MNVPKEIWNKLTEDNKQEKNGLTSMKIFEVADAKNAHRDTEY